MFMLKPNTINILVVDDESADLYAVGNILSRAGYQVVTASGYLRALEMVCDEERRIDLLLTDILMPNGVNGFALARMGRMRRPGLKIVYMTAYEIPNGEALGEILRKPVAEDALLAGIQLALAA